MPTRWQPWILPSWPTMLPVPPVAAETTRVSPDRGLPISSSESVVAPSAEEMGVGEKGDGRNFVEGVSVLAIEENDRFVATLEIGIVGFADFGEDESTHDVAKLDGGLDLGDISDPNAHGGIDREWNLTRARAWPSWRTGRGDSQIAGPPE